MGLCLFQTAVDPGIATGHDTGSGHFSIYISWRKQNSVPCFSYFILKSSFSLSVSGDVPGSCFLRTELNGLVLNISPSCISSLSRQRLALKASQSTSADAGPAVMTCSRGNTRPNRL